MRRVRRRGGRGHPRGPRRSAGPGAVGLWDALLRVCPARPRDAAAPPPPVWLGVWRFGGASAVAACRRWRAAKRGEDEELGASRAYYTQSKHLEWAAGTGRPWWWEREVSARADDAAAGLQDQQVTVLWRRAAVDVRHADPILAAEGAYSFPEVVLAAPAEREPLLLPAECLSHVAAPFCNPLPPTLCTLSVASRASESIRLALGREVYSVTTVGTAAVPGLCGTPVVDLCVVVHTLPFVEEQRRALRRYGFRRRREKQRTPGVEVLLGGDALAGQPGSVAAYCVGDGDRTGQQFKESAEMLVRYLAARPNARDAYCAAKSDGAKVDGGAGAVYEAHKRPVIARFISDARAWHAADAAAARGFASGLCAVEEAPA